MQNYLIKFAKYIQFNINNTINNSKLDFPQNKN